MTRENFIENEKKMYNQFVEIKTFPYVILQNLESQRILSSDLNISLLCWLLFVFYYKIDHIYWKYIYGYL